MRRRWLSLVGWLLVAGLVAILLVPFWLSGPLRLIAPRFGLDYARYERIGYNRFALHEVVLTRPTVTIKLARIEGDTPLLWSWRHLRGRSAPVTASSWEVHVRPPGVPRAARRAPGGWLPLRARLQRIAAQLERWLPEARVGAGVVSWPRGEIRVESAAWRDRELRVKALGFRRLLADVDLKFGERDAMELRAQDRVRNVAVQLRSLGADVSGAVSAFDQDAALSAEFREAGWMPAKAVVDAPGLAIPAERLRLGEHYQPVSGRLHVSWRENHFLADAALHAKPTGTSERPPLDVAVKARGDTAAITIETLQLRAPGISAELNRPVTIDRTGALREEAAAFAIQANLEEQPWISATGAVQGQARILRREQGMPAEVEFEVAAARIAAGEMNVAAAEIVGRLQWPALSFTRLRVEGAAGDELRGYGGWNFRSRELGESRITGSISRETIARWIPPSVQFASIAVDARAQGPLAKVVHSGRLEVEALRYAKFHPAAVRLNWAGVEGRVETVDAEVRFPTSQLAVGGSVDPEQARLERLEFRVGGREVLRLESPAQVSWSPRLALDDLRLRGPTASLDASLSWAEQGSLQLALRGFPSEWIASVHPLPAAQWDVQSLAFSGEWRDGPMVFSTAGGAALMLGNGRKAVVNLSARGSAEGVVLEALRVMEGDSPVLNATGRVPVTFRPTQAPLVRVDPEGELEMEASSVPNAAFWQQLATLAGVELRAPELVARLDGTWKRPRGQVELRAERVVTDPARFRRPLPSVENVNVAVSGDGDGIRLDRVSFAVEQQRIMASGFLPIAEGGWAELARNPLPALRKSAAIRIEIPDAEVRMFARFLPAALAPAGRLSADLRVERGSLGGFVRLRDAASRPLGPLGILQDINADVEFEDRVIRLREVRALAGGRPIRLAGTVEIPAQDWLAGSASAAPRYDVTLVGENLPFVRQSGLLLRGDVDLKLQSPVEGPPAITGKVTLRDSLFLADVRAFLPQGGAASPSRRPPYFSVDTAPLNTWGLNVSVVGSRFIRMRMPVFAGVASARFTLSGTLGEPRAIGDATVDEGQVLMPFASFDVTQGVVRLTEESPYEPTIFLRGSGRHWGYDLNLEVVGKASAPKITFSSNPALDSDDVLLMVMTGAAPRDEVTSSLTHRAVQIGAFFGQTVVGSLTGSGARPDRLSIESGERISRQGKETYEIEYKLNNRWTVTGEYDEYDEYNAGFKWRISPRKRER